METCNRCYQPIKNYEEHGISLCPFEPRRGIPPSKGFEAHFDIGLGRYVTGWGDVRLGMREEKLDFRDHPSKGELAARVDRRMEARKRSEVRR